MIGNTVNVLLNIIYIFKCTIKLLLNSFKNNNFVNYDLNPLTENILIIIEHLNLESLTSAVKIMFSVKNHSLVLELYSWFYNLN